MIGTWAAVTSSGLRERLIAWKSNPPFDPGEMVEFAAGIVELIGMWSGGVYAPRTVVTVPPQGASRGPYAAEALGRSVADKMAMPFVPMLRRTDVKKYHGPWDSRKQLPYLCELPDPRPEMVLVIDDLCTSGTTMRLALTSIRAAGIPAFGFCYSGS